MAIFFGWIVFSFLAGFIGSDRECGFARAFIISVIFSPLVGLIYALASTKKSTIEFQKRLMAKSAPVATHRSDDDVYYDKANENIIALYRLKEEGLLSEDELKTKVSHIELDPKYQQIRTNRAPR